ncbi:metal-dependent hydrolase family protein [Hyphobacterium marinum]|uniref:Amidohydrolase family protein n=1 Tax=Hyphobacterium marinum TaxID=3116574 RepID=A0ABU7LWP0_9PROT|nr:amidohydrolase family protein [Hyphobacterium sp. Y6023]MEE2565963.1 amidohydrolase family protein [Hyphobacterium sp. Y6023]
MIRSLVAAAAALLLTASTGAQDTDEAVIVIHAGWLLAVPGEAPEAEQSIVIRGERIDRIEDGYVEIDGATVIDLSSQYVLPGLIDSHVHLLSELNPNRRLQNVTFSSADWALDGVRNARSTLMAGFTSVQDVGGELEAIVALRDAVRDGDVIGPRMRVSGPAVTPTGGHGDANGYNQDILHLIGSESACNGPADCRRAVRELIRARVDLIKITATGGVLSQTAAGTEQQFFDDELESIMEAARMMGRYVTAHAHGVGGINSAIRAGVHSIEHGSYLDDESIRLFRDNGVYLVPTLLAGATVAEIAETANWMTPEVRQKSIEVGPQMLDMARRAHTGGVQIAFGTDSGVSRHGDNAREFPLLVEAGLTPMEAIVSATVTASEHIQMADAIGTIEPGKFADIIATDENPWEDVSALLDVDFVMQGGQVHKNQ